MQGATTSEIVAGRAPPFDAASQSVPRPGLALIESVLKPLRDRGKCARDGKGGPHEQFAQHKRQQGALAVWQLLKVVALQISCHKNVEAVFGFVRAELLDNRIALGVRNIGRGLVCSVRRQIGFKRSFKF